MSDAGMSGTLYVVATPIGNLEDITLRAIRVLGCVQVIAAEDTRKLAQLLSHLGIPRPPRVMSLFEGNEASRVGGLLAELDAGRDVALVSEAGTPGISDPGHRVIRAAIEASVPVDVIPGPVAAVTALVGSGLGTDQFLFIGFPPRTRGARQQLFGSLRTRSATLVLYESPERLSTTLTDLVHALGGDRRAALARELTKRHQEYARASLAELESRYRDSRPRGECTLVIEGQKNRLDQDVMSEADIEARMRELLDRGFGPRDAAARLVVATGRPRRQLYQLALALGRERSSD